MNTLVLLSALVLQAPTDTAALRKELNKTASDYESSLRSSAPHKLQRQGYCDEQVGRFCVIFDRGRMQPLGPEPREVAAARAKVLAAYRRANAAWPNDSTLIAPLLRYLVEADQAGEAVAIASAYTKVEGVDEAWAAMLLGFAQHAAGDDGAAEETFARAIRVALPFERSQMHDPTVLLANAERDAYNKLPPIERSKYLARLWSVADPLYLTPGNESVAEHLSRRVYGRILAMAPANSELGWGPDQEALMMRFGVPVSRTQQFTPQKVITEHYHPEQLTFVPPSMLSKGALKRFEPGSAWPYDTIRAHSGYAPSSIRWMQVLEHQVSRFPQGDSVVMRADFRFQLDSLVKRPARVEIGLFALDSLNEIIAERYDTVTAEASLLEARLDLRAPSRARAYSVEARELGSRQAGRARYAFTNLPRGRLALSDLVIVQAADPAPPARNSESFKPLNSLVIERGQAIGLFMETRGLRGDAQRQSKYRVELEVLEQDRPGVFTRAVRGLGRALGVSSPDVAPRITWNQQQNAADLTTISLQLGKVQLDKGLKLFRVSVTDLNAPAGTPAATVDRLILVR